MKTGILMTTAMALMLAVPAFAQSYSSDRTAGTMPGASGMVTGHENVRAMLLDEDYDRGTARYVVSNWMDTANGLIGQPVYNAAGEKIATVDDVLVDQSGQARTVVLAEGGLLGLGEKHTAFDYQMLARREASGEITASLSRKAIEDAPDFSYNAEDAGKQNTQVMPPGNYRLSAILDADILGPQGDDMGDVDNVMLQEGRVDYLVLSAGETMGMGGKQAAMRYNAVKMTGTVSNPDFSLTEAQANRLERFVRQKVSSK